VTTKNGYPIFTDHSHSHGLLNFWAFKCHTTAL